MIMRLHNRSILNSRFVVGGFYFLYICIMDHLNKILRDFENSGGETEC
jgi:hypothetical protein